MNQENRELYLDLLTKKAISGLDDNEQSQLDQISEPGEIDEFRSLEMTAAAINMAGLAEEPMPAHLYSKISADAGEYFGTGSRAAQPIFTSEQVFAKPRSRSWFGWLGWAAAAAACVALAINLWFTRTQPTPVDRAQNAPPVETPRNITPAEAREEMLKSGTGMVKASWTAGNVKNMQVTGDIVWSDAKQMGFMRFRGLPVNDPSKETYQLWIFDRTQDKATPIDGGTFDVNSDGEVVIPINAKLKASGPEMFAVTMEKPGGVVVSKREKIAAIAKVETQTS
jgi:hypothetical protein